MFDPTIFDNIKIVLEGELYEHDLSGIIIITKRQDIVDLADMSREFIIQFKSRNSEKDNYAEIYLNASTEDLAKEILEMDTNLKPGAELSIKFQITILKEEQCEEFINVINNIWEYRPKIFQNISYAYLSNNENNREMVDEILLKFGRKIDEDNIKDISNLVSHTLKTLAALNNI